MFSFSFLYLLLNSECCFYRWVSGWVSGKAGHLSHCTVVCEQVPAEGQRRLCRARWVMARPGLPFFDPSSWVRWFECRSPPWQTRLVLFCFFFKCFLKGWLLFAVICTDTHVASLLIWLLFCFGLLVWRAMGVAWQQGVACGSSPVAEIVQGYMSGEHWCLQIEEGCGLFFPFLCNSKCWSLPGTSVLYHFGKTAVMLFLTVLCWVLGYNCEVSPVCNFGFKTTFMLTTSCV